MKRYNIINGNNLDVLLTLEENSVDAIITDPPYELGFMGKKWDASGIAYNVELWKRALRVLKPGGYLLAFGGTRTFHRIACAIEDAGFEIRDTIMWLYGSGFPKSHNIGLDVDKLQGCPDRGHRIATANRFHPDGTLESNGESLPKYEGKTEEGKKWSGYGTALKPAYEPIIMARKPIEGTVAKNCLKYGVGGINIDGCRVEHNEETKTTNRAARNDDVVFSSKSSGFDNTQNHLASADPNGRWPANVIHDGSEEATSGMPETKGNKTNSPLLDIRGNNYNNASKYLDVTYERGYDDQGSAARYFYCAKASKKDRDEGLDEFGTKSHAEINNRKEGSAGAERAYGGGTNPFLSVSSPRKNIHPTVKPTELMQYLVRLVCPKGATILDIFNGSGSTGKAVAFENRERDMDYKYIGIELDPEYCRISEARIAYAANKYQYDDLVEIKKTDKIEEKVGEQLSLFDFE